MKSAWLNRLAQYSRVGIVHESTGYGVTGAELVRDYLAPLAVTPALRGHIRTGAKVVGIARRDHGRLHDGASRDAAPFVVHVEEGGAMEALEAAMKAVTLTLEAVGGMTATATSASTAAAGSAGASDLASTAAAAAGCHLFAAVPA